MPTRISDKHPVMDSPSSVSLVICHDLRNNFHAAHSGMLLQVVDSAESTTAFRRMVETYREATRGYACIP